MLLTKNNVFPPYLLGIYYGNKFSNKVLFTNGILMPQQKENVFIFSEDKWNKNFFSEKYLFFYVRRNSLVLIGIHEISVMRKLLNFFFVYKL